MGWHDRGHVLDRSAECGSSIGSAMDSVKLTRREIGRLVHNWIGVSGGYLGNFSYSRHDRFWLDVCDVCVDTSGFDGTTRECFEHTLFEVDASRLSMATGFCAVAVMGTSRWWPPELRGGGHQGCAVFRPGA